MHVSHLLEAMDGGTKKHVQLLIAGLIERGVEVILAVPYPRPFEAKSALMDYFLSEWMRTTEYVRAIPYHPMASARLLRYGQVRGELVRYSLFDVLDTHSAKAV